MSSNKKCALFGIVLFVSLACNLLALGYVVGKPPRPPEGKHKGPHFEMMAEQAKQLPPAQQQLVLDIIDKHRDSIRDAFKEKQTAFYALMKFMKSNDYNRTEAEAGFAKLSEASSHAYGAAQAMMMDIADALPPEERALMMPKPREHGGDKWGARKPAKPPVIPSEE